LRPGGAVSSLAILVPMPVFLVVFDNLRKIEAIGDHQVDPNVEFAMMGIVDSGL